MSNMYSRIDRLCKNNHTNVTELCRELKIGRSSLSELSRGRSKKLNAESTAKIAEYFNVSPSYLTEGIPDTFAEHFIPSEYREEIKSENRYIVNNPQLFSLQDRIDSQIKVYECLFSRSYESQGYNPNHVPFKKYVALVLGQNYTRAKMKDDLFDALIIKYGAETGMEEGTTYAIITEQAKPDFDIDDISYAAYQELENETEEFKQDILDYIKFKKSQKKE